MYSFNCPSFFVTLNYQNNYTMKDNLDYVKLYNGSSITLRILDKILNNQGITTIIKDFHESARLGGFGSTGETNELFVFEKDIDKAKKILKNFLASENK